VLRKLSNKIARDSTSTNASQSGPLKSFVYSARENSESLEAGDRRKRGKGRPRSSAPRSSVTRTEQTNELSDIEINQSKQRYQVQSAIPARPKKSSTADIDAEDDDILMIDPPDIESTRSRKSGEPRSDSSTAAGSATSGNIIVDTLNEVRTQILQDIEKGAYKKQLYQITAKSWQSKVYLECAIKNYISVEEIFLYHASNLVKLLGPEWHNTEIYQWAKEKASLKPTFNTITEEQIQQIIRRVKKSARGGHTEKLGSNNSQRAVNQYAGKQTPKRGRPSGKAAGLRPSTGSKKRLRHETGFQDDMDIDEDGSLKKRSKKSHYFTEEDDGDDDSSNEDSDSDDNADEDEEASSGESKALGGSKHGPIAFLAIRAEKLPTAQPRGPNQTWTCEEAGCGYVVRAANEEEGQKLISAHFDEHEKKADDAAQEAASSRVDLAIQEGSRGHMPVKYAYLPPFLILIMLGQNRCQTQG
jgi:hypothetical protein